MNTGRKLKRWIAPLLLAATMFSWASVAFSACQVERGRLAQAIGTFDSRPCEDGVMVAEAWTKYPNRCLAHCTADLQSAGATVALIRGASGDPVLALPRDEPRVAARTGLATSPPGTPPPRILFQTLLI